MPLAADLAAAAAHRFARAQSAGDPAEVLAYPGSLDAGDALGKVDPRIVADGFGHPQ